MQHPLEPVPQSRRRPRSTQNVDPIDGTRARELVEAFAPIVRQIAGGFQRRLPSHVLRDDLLAAGMGGLWDAIQKHGADGSANFEWYVRVRVRGAILDELRSQDWLPRRARAAVSRGEGTHTALVRLDDVSDAEQARCLSQANQVARADEEVERKREREELERVVSLLPDRERHIVAMHYFGGVKFKDLGQMLGVSEPRISQLHSRAMGRLRGLMQARAA